MIAPPVRTAPEAVELACPSCGFRLMEVARPEADVRCQVTARCDCGALVSMVVRRGCGRAVVSDERVLLTPEQAKGA